MYLLGIIPAVFCSQHDSTTLAERPPLQQRALSVFEQRRIEEALQEQQRMLLEGTPQRVAGRVHAGPSFRCRPAVVTFGSFDVGQRYSQNVEVTNVSLGFSTFRVLPLDDELEGIISVSFEAPGRLSAGRSAQLKVTFTPRKEEDLTIDILLLSPTGPQKLPVVCRRRRSVLFFHPPLQSPYELSVSLKNSQTTEKKFTAARSEPTVKQQQSMAAPVTFRGKPSEVPFSINTTLPTQDQPKEGVLYLSSGEVQLGEVAAVRFKLGNTGSLPTAYHLYPIFSDEPSNFTEEAGSLSKQQNEQPSSLESSRRASAEESAVEGFTGEERCGAASKNPRSPRLLQGEAKGAKLLPASGWHEALQGEAVVLAKRLRVSNQQNNLSWNKVKSWGLSTLLHKGMDSDGQSSQSSAAPLPLSFNNTLVKSPAGKLEASQTQEISIIYAPTRTGLFLGFFSLQFSDPEVLCAPSIFLQLYALLRVLPTFNLLCVLQLFLCSDLTKRAARRACALLRLLSLHASKRFGFAPLIAARGGNCGGPGAVCAALGLHGSAFARPGDLRAGAGI